MIGTPETHVLLLRGIGVELPFRGQGLGSSVTLGWPSGGCGVQRGVSRGTAFSGQTLGF